MSYKSCLTVSVLRSSSDASFACFFVVLFMYINNLHYKLQKMIRTVNSKINGTHNCVYLPISKLHSISAVANLLAHNSITISNYYWQVNSLRLK